jgi:hypothetical protein
MHRQLTEAGIARFRSDLVAGFTFVHFGGGRPEKWAIAIETEPEVAVNYYFPKKLS